MSEEKEIDLPSEDQKRFIELSWWILEKKFAYYLPESLDPSWKITMEVSDIVYDKAEEEYKQLAQKLGLEASACSKVGFPSETP